MPISKEKILEFIEKAKRVEEEAIPNLATHVMAAISFLEESSDLRVRITELLNKLKEESTEHADILDGIVDYLSKK